MTLQVERRDLEALRALARDQGVSMASLVRQAVRHGGVLASITYRRRVRPRRLLVLVDCSESATVRPGLATLISALLGLSSVAQPKTWPR